LLPITVRPLQPNEGRLYLGIHSRAIRGFAAAHYSRDVIEAWSAPITDERVRRFLENRDGEIRLIAELDGAPVGLGALVIASSELWACYVEPDAARKGVGTALVREIERIAIESGLRRLELLASVNAESFYAFLGYHAEERTELALTRAVTMAAVKMAKALR
jgi:putative acetyltransferase